MWLSIRNNKYYDATTRLHTMHTWITSTHSGETGFPRLHCPEYFVRNIFRTVMYTKFGVHIKNKRNILHIRIEFGLRIHFLTIYPLTMHHSDSDSNKNSRRRRRVTKCVSNACQPGEFLLPSGEIVRGECQSARCRSSSPCSPSKRFIYLVKKERRNYLVK